jgi:hypothetical protein
LLIEALELYFDAYLVPISEGEGRPSLEILTQAESVGLSAVQRTEVRNAVHRALDAVIGFDFEYPQGPPASLGNTGVASFGNIRGTPDGATAIAMAARTAMVNAISTRNLNAIAGPLEGFWATHPDFHPNHTGREYPHGHADYEESVGTPLAGQIATLRLILLNYLLNDGAPLCGNDVRETLEECDGSDDNECPAVCSTECRCGFIP